MISVVMVMRERIIDDAFIRRVGVFVLWHEKPAREDEPLDNVFYYLVSCALCNRAQTWTRT